MVTKYVCDMTGEEIKEGPIVKDSSFKFFFPLVAKSKGKLFLYEGSDDCAEYHLGARARRKIANELVKLFGDDIIIDLDAEPEEPVE